MENQTPNSRLALFVGGFKDGERSRRDTWPLTLQFKRLITPGGNQRPVETYRLGHIHTSHGPFAVYVHDSIEAGGAIFELLAGYKVPATETVLSTLDLSKQAIDAYEGPASDAIKANMQDHLEQIHMNNPRHLHPSIGTSLRITISEIPICEEIKTED
jgi:hypothetical protein